VHRLETITPFTFTPSSRFCKSSPSIILFQVRSLNVKKSFQLIVWLLPSFTGGAISVSIIGILLGPIYPIVVNHTAHVLPRHLVNGTIGWMTACGAAGSALLPFVTGTMASEWGIESIQPLCVFLNLPVSKKDLGFFFFLVLIFSFDDSFGYYLVFGT